ncbi:hypothetical protein Y032_0570g98 [Ancylostoma ceylanicum]|uniref:Uncharacterized protein n=1 Tax=Ancylostoma ceylanicum TaxID=53326 RepID=A0A016WNL5_9BILA|nr:hypothetical protein Y032_0570g98 [Ancylostoma ceylanicum]
MQLNPEESLQLFEELRSKMMGEKSKYNTMATYLLTKLVTSGSYYELLDGQHKHAAILKRNKEVQQCGTRPFFDRKLRIQECNATNELSKGLWKLKHVQEDSGALPYKLFEKVHRRLLHRLIHSN